MCEECEIRSQLTTLLPRLYRFAFSLACSKDGADDLVQASCERALAQARQWRRESRFDSWLYSIAYTIWKDQIRAQSVRQEAAWCAEPSTNESHKAWKPENHPAPMQLAEHIQRLPEQQRSLLLVVYVEGYTYREAARILHLPVGIVMSSLARARSSLAEQLTSDKPAISTRRMPDQGLVKPSSPSLMNVSPEGRHANGVFP